jgi:hypothetical protein
VPSRRQTRDCAWLQARLLVAGVNPARERLPGADLNQLDAHRLPWRDEWDVAGAFDVIEHIDACDGQASDTPAPRS